MSTAAFTFARMNPPTIGHELLVDKLKSTPAHDRFIFLSPSHDSKRNPLSHARRVELATKAFYDYSIIISDRQYHDMFACMIVIYNMGFSDVSIIVGGDRVDELKKRFPMYNGSSKQCVHKLYNFNSITVINAGSRDESANGLVGMSASKMREAAKLGDYETFENGLPKKLRPMSHDILREIQESCLSDHLVSS